METRLVLKCDGVYDEGSREPVAKSRSQIRPGVHLRCHFCWWNSSWALIFVDEAYCAEKKTTEMLVGVILELKHYSFLALNKSLCLIFRVNSLAIFNRLTLKQILLEIFGECVKDNSGDVNKQIHFRNEFRHDRSCNIRNINRSSTIELFIQLLDQ